MVLKSLTATRPVRDTDSLAQLGLGPERVRFEMNRTFFPTGAGLYRNELTEEITVSQLISAIQHKLAAQDKH